MLGVLIARSRIVRSASALRRRPLIIGSIGLATIEARLARPTLKARLLARTSPSARRSSGTKPSPAWTACGGLRGAKRRPSSVMAPRSGRSAPKRRRASSLRPAPTRPPSPSTSPFRKSKLIVVDFRRPAEPAHGQRDLACRGRQLHSSELLSIAPPTIASTNAWRVRPAPASSATERPSRKTVTRWQSSRISSSRCET